MHLGRYWCFLKIFLFLSICWLFRLVLTVKYTWKRFRKKYFWGCYFVGARIFETVPEHIWMRHYRSIRDVFVLQMEIFEFITIYKNLFVFPRVNSRKFTIKFTNFNIFIIPTRRKCAYQGMRNVSFLENLLNE